MVKKIMNNQHPLFIKYRRDWLHEITGFSKGYLSRVATGRYPPSRSFIQRVCFQLNEPEEALFLPDACQPAEDCSGEPPSSLGQWLEDRCKKEHLSLREAGARVGLSHSTIRDIINGAQTSPETIRKLVNAFADGTEERMALEDHLLVLAGCRTERPGEELTELLAQLMDKVRQFSEPQLKMMIRFADFLVEMDEK